MTRPLPRVYVYGDARDIADAVHDAGSHDVQFAVDPAESECRIYALHRLTRSHLLDMGRETGVAAPRVLFVLPSAPSASIARAVLSQFGGLLTLDDLPATLLPAILAVRAGLRVLASSAASRVDQPALTGREKQILAMVVLDLSNASIAKQLHLTESSVKNHLTSAFAKLEVTSRSEAAALILDPDAGLGLGILRITPEEP